MGFGWLRLSSAPLWFLGLQTGNSPGDGSAVSDGIQPAPALFVGRLHRQAWLTGLRAQADPNLFAIGLGIDESRISLADLEIDLEEYAAGDLASARRIRLGDLALPPGPVAAGKDVAVVLPTLGPGLQRQIRLFDRNGLLLDATDRLAMVEKIDIEGTAAGAQPFRVTVGQRNAVGLLDRLKCADQADAAYRALLEAGLPGPVVDDAQHGLPALTACLSQAHGHLDVLDPYFGWDVSDWSVLAQVPVPIRVLTGHGYYDGGVLRKRKVIQPPPGTAPQAPSFEVRTWRGHPAWHDRVYLWAGGGLSVGTSPSGLGKRIARIDRLGAAEATGWQSHFAAWWSSQDVASI